MAANRAPYSTFQTHNHQHVIQFPKATSDGNVVSFTPPGFTQSLNVKFPDTRLAVCEACKKNFKTRETCRVRLKHTAPPWTVEYICMTLDDSCIDEATGKIVDDKPMICRMVQWQPYCIKKPFHKKTPVCAICKKTNRTRGFCREKHQHLLLPWTTVYVLLSTLESADPATVVAAPSKPIGATVSSDTDDSKLPASDSTQNLLLRDLESPSMEASKDEVSVAESKASELSDVSPAAVDAKRLAELGESETIDDMGDSRSMLITISSAGTSINWLRLQEFNSPTLRHNLSPPVGMQHLHHPQPHYPQRQSPHTARASQPSPAAGVDQRAHAYPRNTVPIQPHQYPQMHQPPIHPQAGYRFPPHHHRAYPRFLRPTPHQHAPPQHYVPVIRHSPGPSTPVPGARTLVLTPSTATITAGEAAAAQRRKRSQAAAGGENRDSQSPAGPSPPPHHHPHAHHLHRNDGVPIQPAPVVARAAAYARPSPPLEQQQQIQPLPYYPDHGEYMMYQQLYQAQLPPPYPMHYPAGGAAAAPIAPYGVNVAGTFDPHNPSSRSESGDGEDGSTYHESQSPGKRLPHHLPPSEGRRGDENMENSKRARLD